MTEHYTFRCIRCGSTELDDGELDELSLCGYCCYMIERAQSASDTEESLSS